MTNFDSATFDAAAFGDYVGRMPTVKMSELAARGVLTGNSEIRALFKGAGSASYAKVPLCGVLTGAAQNYDGETDIVVGKTPRYEFGTVVVGRANAWSERDFNADTSAVDYMDTVAKKISEYHDATDESTLLSVLAGVFAKSESDGEKDKFIAAHTLDITKAEEGKVDATTLNDAVSAACGSARTKFSVVLLHSAVAANLENLQLMNYLTYTDKDGVTRDLTIGSWNGKSVIITDAVPAVPGDGSTTYTSYVLGEGSIFYEDIGAKMPYEMHRSPADDGGADVLYTRTRKVLHPFGFDYTKSSQATMSPTDAELAKGENWTLVKDEDGAVIDHRLIPICRIVSLG